MRRGVLVLSEFAGAARELRRALLIDPHDMDGLVAALDTALSMPEDEARRRMRDMRRVIRAPTVYDWADDFLHQLGRPPEAGGA